MSEQETKKNEARRIIQELIDAFRDLGCTEEEIREELRGLVKALRRREVSG